MTDGSGGALGGEHHGFPEFVPRFDGVVELLHLIEILQGVFQYPPVPERAEHLVARRMGTQRDHTSAETAPLLTNHAQTVRGASDSGTHQGS
ncbi:hypothetical protein [Streptomyces sp. NPDC102415]|uniref:hypothetical protein n=1 Tax=unclassified Streptomyces TaxID=2593676 RepID=UPI0038006953